MERKEIAKESENNAKWELDTKKYWRSFEHLSLEVLSLMLKTREKPAAVIKKDVTQKTRDQGVDGYIRFRVKDDRREYTVEAKLRSGSTIALRDIATSILYYLIGVSDRHFIVTNVVFTAETLRVLDELQRQMGSPLEAIDGHKLKQMLNDGLTCKHKDAPQLIALLKAQPLPPREAPAPAVKKASYHVLDAYVDCPSRTRLRDDIIGRMEAGEKLFLIEGEPGTGKSRMIREVAEKASGLGYQICRIDMSRLHSPRLFILNVLQVVLGLDLSDLLDGLDSAGKEEVSEDLSFLERGAAGDYGRAIRYLLTLADDQEESASYLLRSLLTKLLKRCFHERAGLLIIENLADSRQGMERYLLYVLDILADQRNGLAVMIETPLFRNRDEASSVPLENWREVTRSLRNTRVGGQPPQIIRLGNYTEPEARDLLEHALELETASLEFENAIIARVGTNPGFLFSAIALINKRRLFTRYDVERLPLFDRMAPHRAYIGALLEDEASAGFFHLALALLNLLDGSIPLSVNDCVEREFSAPPGALAKTGLAYETNTELRVQNRYTIDALNELLDMGTKRAAERWLLSHLEHTGWKEPYKSARALWLRLLLREETAGDAVEAELHDLVKADAREEAGRLLLEAYRYHRDANRLEQALEYLLSYLDRHELIDKYNTDIFRDLLSEADRIRAQLELSGSPVSRLLTVRLYTLHYWQCRMSYDYDPCFRYIDAILAIEADTFEEAERKSLERHFVEARMFHALNFKEQGDRRRCVRAFRYALKRYPENRDLRVSCYLNVAAFFYHSAPGVARAFLNAALQLIESAEGKRRDRWIWAYHDRILCDLYAGCENLQEILRVREIADKRYSLSNLARSFNFEGYVHFCRGEPLSAFTLFMKAAEIGLTMGGNKPGFLYLTNAAAAKLAHGEDAAPELIRARDWLLAHFETAARKIVRNKARSRDHLFAAVVSWVTSVRAAGLPELEADFRQRWEETCDQLDYGVFDASNVHPDFRRRNAVIVLF